MVSQTLDARTDAQVILYSIQCCALHWTDKKNGILSTHELVCC